MANFPHCGISATVFLGSRMDKQDRGILHIFCLIPLCLRDSSSLSKKTHLGDVPLILLSLSLSFSIGHLLCCLAWQRETRRPSSATKKKLLCHCKDDSKNAGLTNFVANVEGRGRRRRKSDVESSPLFKHLFLLTHTMAAMMQRHQSQRN